MQEEVLTLRRKVSGPEHPETLKSMGNLAACYWSLKQLDKSVPLFEELLRRLESTRGRMHPETQTTVANLGVNYKDAGRVAEAIPLLEEAYRASKKFPTLSKFVIPLFDAYAKAGKAAETAKLIDELLEDARKTSPGDSPQMAGKMAAFGLNLLQIKEYAVAEPLLRECLTIREKMQPDAWTTFNTHSMLGGALLGQKKYADAEPLLLKGYEGMKAREKSIPSQGITRIREALGQLIELYTATNKPAGVKKWRAEREKYPMPKEAAAMPEGKSDPDTLKTAQALQLIKKGAPAAADTAPPSLSPADLKSLEANLESVRKAKGPEHADTIAAMTKLASACGADGSGRKAIKLGKEALALARRALPAGDPQIAAAMRALIPLYRSVDIQEDAAKLEAELKTLPAPGSAPGQK